MEFVCRRCNDITKRNPYRVTTEDAGVVLLNMVVCSSCARLAKRLGLPAVKMKWAKTAANNERDHGDDGQGATTCSTSSLDSLNRVTI
jgi:hypothetical protein